VIGFLGFVSFVVVFVLVFGLRSRMRLVELRVYGASPIPPQMKVDLEGAARAATAEAYARSVAAATAAAAERAAYATRIAEERFAAEAARRAAAEAAYAASASTSATATESMPAPQTWTRPAPRPAEPVASAPAPQVRPATPSAPPPVAAPQAPAPAAREKKKINWELFAGGRLMNVVGAIALVVGFGLLLKYAFDQNWIDAQLRVMSGIVLGAVAIASGMALHAKRKTWFVNGVFGIGIGLWYASGYAAFAGYHLVPAPAAYAFMSFVTIAAFAIALRYDSIAVALVGWAGGFLTPFVAGSASAGEVGLASYLVFLDSGLLAISLVRRRWFVLQPLALAASYVAAVAWYLQNGANAPASVSAIAIASLWVVFFAAETIDVLRQPARRAALKTISSLVNLAASGTCLFAILGHAPIALETVTALAAIGYAATYAGVVRFAAAHLVYRYLYAFSAGTLAALFILERFRSVSVAIAFAALALVVAVLSRVRRTTGSTRVAYEALVVSFAAFATATIFTLPFASETVRVATGWGPLDLRFDAVFLTLAFVGFAIDRLWRHSSVHPAIGLYARVTGLVAIVAAERLHVAGSAAGIALAADALAVALVDRLLRARGLAYGVRHEVALAGAAFLALGAVQICFAPLASARDVATIVWIAVAFALGLRPEDASSFAKAAAIAFRSAGFAGIAELEWAHAGGYGLATLFAGSAILVAAVDCATRRLPRRGLAPSAFTISSAFLALGTMTALAREDAFVSSPFHIAFGTQDAASLAILVAFFAVDRLFAGSPSTPTIAGPILRVFGLLTLGLLDAMHLHGNALATTFALEALVLAGIDAALRSVRSAYASPVETVGSGAALAIAAILAFAFGAMADGASVVADRTLAFSYGGVDLALVTFAVAMLAYVRVAAALGVPGSSGTAFRQGAVAAAFVAVSVHFSGFERSDGYALLAIAFSIAGARSRTRDLRIDGALGLGLGLVDLAFARWNSAAIESATAFGPVLNESFVSFTTNAVATIVVSELYRRSSGGLDVVARAGRIAGALLAVFGITLDVHDGFERAATAYPIASLAHARLENLEQLAISVGWIVASIALVLIGVRLRIRDFRLLAIGLFDLTILKAFFVDVYALETPYRIVSFIVLGATLMAVSYLYGRVEKRLFGTDEATGETVGAEVPVPPAFGDA
jgi:uncharacterized membrane protein